MDKNIRRKILKRINKTAQEVIDQTQPQANGEAVAEDIFKKVWESFSEADLDRLIKEQGA